MKRTEGDATPAKRHPATWEVYDMERKAIINNIGAQIELTLSRGPTVRGRLVDFDPKYAKIAVEVELGSGRKGLQFVRMGYVSAFLILDPKDVAEIKGKPFSDYGPPPERVEDEKVNERPRLPNVVENKSEIPFTDYVKDKKKEVKQTVN